MTRLSLLLVALALGACASTPPEADRPARAEAMDATGLTGTWDYSIRTPVGDRTGTFTLTDDGGTLSGSVTGDDGASTPFSSVTRDGDSVSMTFSAPDFGTITFSGVVTGDAFRGDAAVGAMGSFPLTATRQAR